ncbi:GNAT family N-acetyltransferase [Andreprevotia sp. IGB-42]|uniref:GNAT family N-acetyltransferase n=1 Tax=Andreprevotia sp. IGB-42 TaxID=2497473 RepID=UPI001356FFC9|nr:GNAT family protein [Andreprevotia sp. IGB-42]
MRDIQPADTAAVFALFANDSVTEFYDVASFSDMAEAAQWIASCRSAYPAEGMGGFRWAIALAAAPDTLIGSCGFYAVHPQFCSLAIGYDLHPAYWGNGYAAEAVRAMLNFCFTRHFPCPVNRVTATTDLGSHKSITLLRKLGFVEEGVLRQYGYWKGKFHDVRLFSLLQLEWRAGVPR